MADNTGYELGWDSEIEKDGGEFIPLNGDFDFTVTGFERGFHEAKPGGKIPSCKKAELELTVNTNGSPVTVRDSLFLYSTCEGRLCAFFSAIGQRKKGERIKPNWNAVLGAKGKAKFYIDEYTGSDGKQYKNNKVKRYFDKPAASDDWTKLAEAAPPADDAPMEKWKQGTF